MKNSKAILILIPVLILVMLMSGFVYQLEETEQVILTQFGKPVGKPVTEAGLKMKIPFIQEVNTIEKRILEWDGSPNDMPTKDKLYISVDTFGRWRISDPLQYFLRLRDERSAESRIEDILGSETRNAVAKHELIEIVRSTSDRIPLPNEELRASNNLGQLESIDKGRQKIEEEIFQASAAKLKEFGIELLDVRFKRINYNEKVWADIYNRMISERMQIAERFRSEGAGEAAKILGNKERELKTIESVAYKTIQETRGKADARASEIYALAYNSGPEAADLYEFLKTMEIYKKVLDSKTTLVLSTGSDLFKFLKSKDGEPAAHEASP